MLQRSILICDPDPRFVEELLASSPAQVSLLGARTLTEAQHQIANRHNRLAAICVNPAVSAPSAIPLIRFCHAHRPATPLSFLTEDPDFPPSDLDLEALHVQKALRKPITAARLVQELVPSTVFELDKAMEQADTAAAGATGEHEDASMHPIATEAFLCGSKSFFDVYVRLGGKRYLKILKARDAFDAERVGSYLRKGVKHFYVKKEAQLYFLQYCDKLVEAILSRPEFSAELKQTQVLNLGRETTSYLEKCGLSESSLLSAAKFVEHTHSLTKSLPLKAAPDLRKLVDQLKTSDHGAGTSMIVSMLLDAIGFRDSEVISVIALGAFFHDLGLLMLPHGLGERNYDDLTDEEKTEYEKHPTLGADAVARIPNLNPLVAQIVRQHHERRNRKGYPSKLGPGAIAPMAEIIGIADIFQELICQAKEDPSLDPIRQLERNHFDLFSFQTVDGFRKAFLMQKK